MASVVTEKLYPPVMGSSIPAFYDENGTAVIAVPFAMNRAVSRNSIKGFALKIKTVQSNTYITTLKSYEVENSISNRVIKFYWYGTNLSKDFAKIKLGQYLKVQIAYLDKTENENVGYFSTVGIVKYTSKPTVYIEGLQNETNRIGSFRTNYTGVYLTGEDKSERPYSYIFYLYDRKTGLLETTGWKLHNSSVNSVMSESLSLEQATDSYTFQTLLEPNKEYLIQYGVRTINNLEVFSPLYTCVEPDVSDSALHLSLVAENIFEDGYIQLHLEKKETFQPGVSDEELINLYGGNRVSTTPNGKVKTISQENEDGTVIHIITLYEDNKLEDNPVSIQVCRAEKTDNFSTWVTLKKVYFDSYDDALEWKFKDFTVEQGVAYWYCYREYNEHSVQSNREVSNEVVADFEDMFLWDGVRQVKIRFNPKVSSFKTNHLESKTNTIGSKYPFFFRNGIVEYREFPISGLISYLIDENELFINHYEDLNIIIGQDVYRNIGTPVNQNIDDTSIGKSWETSVTLDSIGYNMRAERRFKMKLLEWLGNGEIKLFRSPAEGNFLVRLMNVSLSPEDRLGRMLHSFSATAYEAEDLTYENLTNLNFINTEEEEEQTYKISSIKFKDKIETITDINLSVKINEHDIYDRLYIGPAPNTEGGFGFFVRLGVDSPDKRVFIQAGGLNFESENSLMPDVFFNIQDNAEIIREYNPDAEVSVESAVALVGDAVLTYGYYLSIIQTGEFNSISNVYIQNQIQSYIGPFNEYYSQEEDLSNVAVGSAAVKQVLKFFVLDFKKKPIVNLTFKNNKYYNNEEEIAYFDETSLYEIHDETANTTSKYYYKDKQLIQVSDFDYTIRLVDDKDNEFVFQDIPILNLNDTFYSRIYGANGIWLNCACQVKVTEFKEG